MLALVLALAAIWIVVLIGGGLGSLLLRAALVRRLKERHRSIWTELGSPGTVGYDSGVVWKWVWSRQYVNLGDPATERIAKALRVVVLAFLASVAVTIALALVGKLWR
jgi:hypothetical protein